MAHKDAIIKDMDYEELHEKYIRLLIKFVRRYDNFQGIKDDLLQVARLELLRSQEKYDPEKGFAFSTFLCRNVEFRMKRYFQNKANTIRIPVNAYQIFKQMDRYEEENDGQFDIEDFAKKTKHSVSYIKSLYPFKVNPHLMSFDFNYNESKNSVQKSNQKSFMNAVRVEEDFTGIIYNDFIKRLDEREKQVLSYRLEQVPYREIGEEMGFSRQTAKNIMGKIRKKAEVFFEVA